MKDKYDLAIIGSGPGGYVAALHAAHLGKSVCIVEKGAIGGTCLNRGCVPTKAYAASRDVLNKVKKASDFGIVTSPVNIDFKAVFERKNAIVKKTRKSVINLLLGNKVDIVKGTGKLIDKNTVEAFNKKDGTKTTISADNIIIATGSKPLDIPVFKIDHERILTSGDVLKLDTLPKEMVIIGGGIIGCEFASIFSSFGVSITVVELMDTILPLIDPGIVSILRRKFKKSGINILTGIKVEKVAVEDKVILSLSDGSMLSAEKVLVSVGRASNVSGLGLEALGIALDGDRVTVDDEKRTNISNIFAIGDITKGPMLAHKASYDGIRAVCNAFSIGSKDVPFENITSVVFTDPEIAYVGLSEKEAIERGIDVKIGKVFYASSSKALCMGETDGLIKIIAKNDSGVIIGAAICGAHASDLISVLAVSIEQGMKACDIYETVFAHPTLSEIVKETAEDINGLAVHKIYKRG